jgi:hypothetical protein
LISCDALIRNGTALDALADPLDAIAAEQPWLLIVAVQ